MCGIVGYVGDKKAESILISGLKKLEYRGYDSCGISTIDGNNFDTYKTTKRISSLEELVKKKNVDGTIGLGHTRWSTHGGATENNAHPHKSNSGKIMVVHNGIIENYLAIKEMLKDNGYMFYSETDTEVIPNLIEYYYDGNLLGAIKKATDLLEGSYALGIMCLDEPNEIIATKRNSPLIIGIGNDENFIASDFSAILKYTNKICVLENNEFAVVTRNDVKLYANDLVEHECKIKSIDLKDEDTEKNGYEHFMQKEINENTLTIKNTIAEYLKDDKISFDLKLNDDDILRIKHIHIIACGTAMHAGLNGKNVIENLTRIPVTVEVASEFRYKNPILDSDDLAIFISQSGETADTIASIELVKERNIKFLSIVNVKESTIDRMSDNVIYTKAGPEIAVASTKAYVAQVCAIDLFAIYMARLLKKVDENYLNELTRDLKNIHDKVQIVLEKDEEYLEYAKLIQNDKDVFYLGRGLDYYTALEGSLKLKEISYIHSEAVQFGELKHGPIALIENGTHAIVICTSKELMGKVISNVKEIKARGANVLVITDQSDFPEEIYDEIIEIPTVNELLSPIVSVIPLQLIAYHVTVLKGLDVDKPRNLAKSVTVE